MPVMDITVIPAGHPSPSVSKVVREVLKVLDEMKVKYQLTPMSTAVEGDLDTLLEVIKRVHSLPFEMGYPRVVTIVKIDERKDKDLKLEGKIKSVKEGKS